MDEVRRLVAEYESSGQTRADYCAERGLAVGTLDGYRRRFRRGAKLLEIDWDRGGVSALGSGQLDTRTYLALTSGSGWRLEFQWSDVGLATEQAGNLRGLLRAIERD